MSPVLNFIDARDARFSAGSSNPFLPLAPAGDDAGRRAALDALLRETDTAKASEAVLAGQVSVAERHHRDAVDLLKAAGAAVTESKAVATRLTADWLVGDRSTDRPDATGPVLAAQNDRAAAAADAETISGALESLRQDMKAAGQRAKHASEAAHAAMQRIVTAEAESLARDIIADEAAMAIKRRRLLAFVRQVGGGVSVPAAIYQAAQAKAPYDDTHSDLAASDSKAWQAFREALMRNPIGAEAEFPGA